MNNNQPNKPKKPKPGEAGGIIPHVNPVIAIVAIVSFMVLLVVPTLAWGGIYATEAIVDDVINPIIEKTDPDGELIELVLIAKLNTDTGENRNMAKFPETFDPAVVTSQIENWYNDHLPFRSIVYNAYKNTNNKIEKLYEERPDENTPSLREQIMEMFPTASQLKPPSVDIELPSDVTESETLPTEGNTEETLPPFEETLPPFIETMPPFGDDETMSPFEETFPPFVDPDLPPLDGPGDDPSDGPSDGPEDNPGTEPGGDPDDGPGELPGTEPGENPGDNVDPPIVCEHVKGEGVVTTPATCTEYGVMKYYCTKCNAYMGGEYIAKADHVKGEGVVETQPTCNEYGIKKYYCINCDAYMGGDYIAKLEHDYKKISSDGKRICGCYYEDTYECSACQDSYTERTLKKHEKGKKIETVEASYTTYGYTLVSCRDCGGEYRMDIKSKLTDTSPFSPYYRGDKVIEGRYKWLFYRGDNSEAYFNASNLMTNAELAEYVTVMNQLNEICKEKGITLQICIWPNKEQVYPEYVGINPPTQNKRADRLVEYVRANSDLKIIYPISELKAAKAYFETYFQYDTHWNNAGGFVGYQAMLKSLGLETTDPFNVEMYRFDNSTSDSYKRDPYCGPLQDMIGMAGVNYSGSFNYSIKYRPDVVIDSFEGTNGAGDTRHTTAANAPNDCNFVMLADSYRVMQLSYLVPITSRPAFSAASSIMPPAAASACLPPMMATFLPCAGQTLAMSS